MSPLIVTVGLFGCVSSTQYKYAVKAHTLLLLWQDLRGKLQGWDNTNTAQITSHLAHGIHRQLTNVMKEGGVLYNQYTSEPSSM